MCWHGRWCDVSDPLSGTSSPILVTQRPHGKPHRSRRRRCWSRVAVLERPDRGPQASLPRDRLCDRFGRGDGAVRAWAADAHAPSAASRSRTSAASYPKANEAVRVIGDLLDGLPDAPWSTGRVVQRGGAVPGAINRSRDPGLPNVGPGAPSCRLSRTASRGGRRRARRTSGGRTPRADPGTR